MFCPIKLFRSETISILTMITYNYSRCIKIFCSKKQSYFTAWLNMRK